MPPARRAVTIDCEYLKPRLAAAYLLIEGDHAAFIDNNTARAVPLLIAALQAEGLSPAQVDLLVVTHVHLDHAAGTGELLELCPNAKVVAHPRAARHLIDPSRLEASARSVYGDDTFDALYGKLRPVPAARVSAVDDEALVPFGDGPPLRVLHTRGHANHHLCLLDPASGSIFTGDSFGLCYPDLQKHGTFVVPSTSPTDFDAEAAVATVGRILGSGARCAYPTHFGPLTALAQAAEQLRAQLRPLGEGVAAAAAQPEGSLELIPHFERLVWQTLEANAQRRGHPLTDDERELLGGDVMLNAQGLAHAVGLRRRAAEAAAGGVAP